MYGIAVHEAVLAAGVSKSAVTIHQVNDAYDDGQAILVRRVPIAPHDTPQSLRDREHAEEPRCWIELLKRITDGERLAGLDLSRDSKHRGAQADG